jgi:hypothetical protein
LLFKPFLSEDWSEGYNAPGGDYTRGRAGGKVFFERKVEEKTHTNPAENRRGIGGYERREVKQKTKCKR